MDVEDNINIIPVDQDTLNKNGIKPLSPGNSWLYQVKTYDSTGNLTDSYVYADTVVKDTAIDNTNWYATSHYIDYWQTNTSDGLRFRQYHPGQPLLEWLEAKYPGTVGFSWQANSSRRTIAAIDTVINVTAGSFSCYYYTDIKFTNGTGWEYSDIFYSVKTGLIKSETYRMRADSSKYLISLVELITFAKK